MTNKQHSIKLYTEEQLVNTVEAIRDYLKNYPEKFHESMIEKHLKNLEPIEIPSDEEIKQQSDEFELNSKVSLGMHISFENGARWVRDKIQGGNNE